MTDAIESPNIILFNDKNFWIQSEIYNAINENVDNVIKCDMNVSVEKLLQK